jgi:hypothetical protein
MRRLANWASPPMMLMRIDPREGAMWFSQLLLALSSTLVSATSPTSSLAQDTIWMRCSGTLSLSNGSYPTTEIYILDRDDNVYIYGGESYLYRMNKRPFDQTPNTQWKAHSFGISISDRIATRSSEATWSHNNEKLTFVKIEIYDFKNLAIHHAIKKYDYANIDAQSPASETITEKWDWKCDKIAAMPFKGIKEQP